MKRKMVKSNVTSSSLDYDYFNDEQDVQMDRLMPARRPEPTMEAEVMDGDTLASLALRFDCTVADLKRLNKIDKDFEIFARKTLRIPITAHNVLLDTLPTVHKSSGNNSPKLYAAGASAGPSASLDIHLNERLIVASVANSEYRHDLTSTSTTTVVYEDFPRGEGDPSITEPLLDTHAPIPTVVLAKPRMDFSFNGSDCDMNWICLFICILALCFAIPLVYVFYIAEEKIHHDAVIFEASHHHDITHDGAM